MTAKKELHPALKENADKLKRGEPLKSGKKKSEKKPITTSRSK